MDQSNEGSFVNVLGWCLIILSVVAAGFCILQFGKVEVQVDYGLGQSYTKDEWSPTLVITFMAAGLNGVFFGYLLAKMGSVLTHLEALRAKPEASKQVNGQHQIKWDDKI